MWKYMLRMHSFQCMALPSSLLPILCTAPGYFYTAPRHFFPYPVLPHVTLPRTMYCPASLFPIPCAAPRHSFPHPFPHHAPPHVALTHTMYCLPTQATEMARYMVTHCGMNDVVGPQYLASGDERGGAPMSDETRNAVDTEVRRMLVDAKEEVKTLLTTRMEVGGVWKQRRQRMT